MAAIPQDILVINIPELLDDNYNIAKCVDNKYARGFYIIIKPKEGIEIINTNPRSTEEKDYAGYADPYALNPPNNSTWSEPVFDNYKTIYLMGNTDREGISADNFRNTHNVNVDVIVINNKSKGEAKIIYDVVVNIMNSPCKADNNLSGETESYAGGGGYRSKVKSGRRSSTRGSRRRSSTRGSRRRSSTRGSRRRSSTRGSRRRRIRSRRN